jgi:hypothetical protein
MLEQARAKGLSTRIADMHALPFGDGEFDIVIVRQAMQYANVDAALREFSRVAKRGVRVAQIVAENLEQQSLWQNLFGLLGQTGRRVFVAGALAEAVQSAGLQLNYNVVLYGQDRLISPNCTGIQLDTGAIDSLMLKIAPDATRVGDDWIHRVRWEIVGGVSTAPEAEAVPPAML